MSSVSQWGYALVFNCVSLTCGAIVEQLWIIFVPMASAVASAGDVTPFMKPLTTLLKRSLGGMVLQTSRTHGPLSLECQVPRWSLYRPMEGWKRAHVGRHLPRNSCTLLYQLCYQECGISGGGGGREEEEGQVLSPRSQSPFRAST